MKELEFKGKPTDGQIVQYDAETRKWYPVDLPDGGTGASSPSRLVLARSGPVDGDSDGFGPDDVNTDATLGTAITWVLDAGFGYHVAKVDAGTYAVDFTASCDGVESIAAAGEAWVQVNVGANGPGPGYASVPSTGSASGTQSRVVGASVTVEARRSITVVMPADGLLDFNVQADAGATIADLAAVITKIA